MKTHAYLSIIQEICKENHLNVDEIYDKLKLIHPKA